MANIPRPESPPFAAKNQQSQVDRLWLRKRDPARDTVAGIEPAEEQRMTYKPTAHDYDVSLAIPGPTEPTRRPLSGPKPAVTDHSKHEHWKELKTAYQNWWSPKTGNRALGQTGPNEPASEVRVASTGQGVSRITDVTSFHPASDLKPPHMAGVDAAITSQPVTVFTAVQNAQSPKAGAVASPKAVSHLQSQSPLQKLKERLRFGQSAPEIAAGMGGGGGGSGGGIKPASDLAGLRSNEPVSPRAISAHRAMIAKTAPVMDIGSPLPVSNSPAAQQLLTERRPSIPCGDELQPPKDQATSTQSPVSAKSPRPTVSTQSASVATPPKPASQRLFDSVKGLFRRASFSAPTPASDMHNDMQARSQPPKVWSPPTTD